MYGKFQKHLQDELKAIEEAGLYKKERNIASAQSAEITLEDGSKALNFCANNYLGLADSPRLVAAAEKTMKERGYGMSSVRFICGTQDIHKQLERAIADYFHTDDAILYAACFDANGGVFEPLLTAEDAIISDSLNHASIIDGVRLCKAQRFRYANADMADLEEKLKEAQACRFRIIVTDGVFSMDGNVAPMDKICDLAEKYDAMVMVDESHSAGVVGPTGHGVAEQFNCYGRIDIFTGTLGKAFGGAVGGFTTGRQEIIDMLRQRSRPYLFSNSIPPMIAGAGIEMFKMLKERRQDGGGRYLRHRVLLSRGPEGPGPHPCAAIRRTQEGTSGQGHRSLHQGRKGTGRFEIVPRGGGPETVRRFLFLDLPEDHELVHKEVDDPGNAGADPLYHPKAR